MDTAVIQVLGTIIITSVAFWMGHASGRKAEAKAQQNVREAVERSTTILCIDAVTKVKKAAAHLSGDRLAGWNAACDNAIMTMRVESAERHAEQGHG